MSFQPRRHCRALVPCVIFLVLLLAAPAWAAEKMRLRVDDYQIDAELSPHSHKLTAKAKVKFTALEDLNIASFELHNGLRVNKVLDERGKSVSAERVTQDSTVRVQLPNGLSKDSATTLTFDYEGELNSADESPVQGLKLASIDDDTSYLLYAGRWFPVNAYGINRFTATMNVTVPAHMTVIGSGKQSISNAAATKRPSAGAVSGKTYTFVWDKPSFPGTIVAGAFQEFKSDEAGLDLHLFLKPVHKDLAAAYAETAVKEFTYYVTLYGPAPSTTLRVVEIPDDTVPSAWAPEVAAIASRGLTQKVNYRLLANTIAHQWWGVSVSPGSRDDWWLNDGFARYSEARYVEQAAGKAGLEEAVKDMSVGALAYDTVPLSTIGKLDVFSPEVQSLVTDKGAMILHMLRWVEGDQKFDKPRRIVIDPDDRVLKNSSEIKLRASIQRGQGLIQQGDFSGALSEFNKALEVNKNSSLAHYRIAEVFFLQHNYQAAANAYRESLNGDGDPRWTEVWAHIQLGKIFDVTGQRERATNEYRQALQTNDNTQGALEAARRYLQKPFEQVKEQHG